MKKNILLIIIIAAILLGLSWLITCGITAGICACFGWNFTWTFGTGIWLIEIVLRSIFKSSSKK